MDWVSRRFGSNGILASAALLGLADMHALTYAKLGDAVTVSAAAQALAVGVLAPIRF
jgi:hypothetical protein